jgi:hypothetical protein
MAIPTIENLGKESLTEKQREGIETIIKEAVQPKKQGEKESVKIFISFCESPENIHLVEELLDPFLTNLSFDVHYWRKDRKFGNTKQIIDNTIDFCDAIIGLYTKEKKIEGEDLYMTGGNVPHELGRAGSKVQVVLCEEGTKIETLTYPDQPTIIFNRQKYGELFVELLRFLKNSCVLYTESSMSLTSYSAGEFTAQPE